jgi:hypothetical protein
MISKDNLIKSINEMPDSISIDDVLDKLLLIEKINIGLEQSKNGEVITEEELDKQIEKWYV